MSEKPQRRSPKERDLQTLRTHFLQKQNRAFEEFNERIARQREAFMQSRDEEKAAFDAEYAELEALPDNEATASKIRQLIAEKYP